MTLKRILHVDDEPDIREIAETTLKALGGFEVLALSSGKEALELVEGFAPDLIIIDVMMPEMDGPTTLAELRKIPASKNTPVIFMTAKVQSHEVDPLLELGAAGVIPKPFDPMLLCDQIHNICNNIANSSKKNHKELD